MIFSRMYKTLRSVNTYNSHARPKISAHKKETAVEVEIKALDRNDEASARFSPVMIEERFKPNLELLNAQISALIEMMDKFKETRPENLWREVPADFDFNLNRHSLKHPEPQDSHL